MNDVVLCLWADAVARHSRALTAFAVFHPLHGSVHYNSTTQFVHLIAGEVGDGHPGVIVFLCSVWALFPEIRAGRGEFRMELYCL